MKHNEFLQGLPFADACRCYVLKYRPVQYISDQPIEVDEIVDGIRMHYFQNPLKHFPADDPAGKHCYSREELISEACRQTGLPEAEACSLLNHLFSFQVDLTWNHYGAVCKKYAVFGIRLEEIGETAIPYSSLEKELPEEWYISLQIPDAIIERMVWSCRKHGHCRQHPCSHAFAERLLCLYRRRRGEFIRKYSLETLKFFWLEYGSMRMTQREIEAAVRKIQSGNGEW